MSTFDNKKFERRRRQLAANPDGLQIINDGIQTSAGKMDFELEVGPHLVKEVKANLAKIQYCIKENEAFGLQCEESVIIFLPESRIAVWYDKQLNKTIMDFPNVGLMAMCISTYLTTHLYFMGPQTALDFVTIAKKLDDVSIKAQSLISRQALPNPPHEAGPVESGADGI